MRLVQTAASAIRAQQVAIDTIGNNLANVNTPGFKANQMDFAEALSSEVRSEEAITAGNSTVAALDVGVGVLYNANGTNFKQGNLTPTDRSLDLGINGAGFFQVKTLDGLTGYTRAGVFQVDSSGQLTDMQGNTIIPSIAIPSGVEELSVASNGEITGVVAGVKTVFGQISLAGFQNPSGLVRNGNNLFVPSENSGIPLIGQPGTTLGNQVLGTIRGNSLEQSNVDLTTSMTELIQVQRAYQINARLVKDGDLMWGIANTMRR
jgi:flagellar basal-body rod protein FlgG